MSLSIAPDVSVRSLVRASRISEGMVISVPDKGLITVANVAFDGSLVLVTNRVYDTEVDMPVATFPASSMVPCALTGF